MPKELLQSTGFLLKRLGMNMKERSYDAFEPTGFTPSHHGVLSLLDEGARKTQGEIADALGYDRSQLVGSPRRLQERGLAAASEQRQGRPPPSPLRPTPDASAASTSGAPSRRASRRSSSLPYREETADTARALRRSSPRARPPLRRACRRSAARISSGCKSSGHHQPDRESGCETSAPASRCASRRSPPSSTLCRSARARRRVAPRRVEALRLAASTRGAAASHLREAPPARRARTRAAATTRPDRASAPPSSKRAEEPIARAVTSSAASLASSSTSTTSCGHQHRPRVSDRPETLAPSTRTFKGPS